VDSQTLLYAVPVCGVLALVYAALKSGWINRQDAGNEVMTTIAGHIREGAMAFLRREYAVLAIFVVVVAALLALVNRGRPESSVLIGVSVVAGAVCSAAAGFFGMRVATAANVRTAAAARGSLNDALKVAFSGGAVMGFCVVGLGLVGLSVLYLVYDGAFGGDLARVINVLTGFSFGASSIALFARVGGGIYTKAADVGADLVGKVEAGIPEDDPRNPATIADNVGDNVGDVAGMGADLFESYVGAMIAALALAAAGATSRGIAPPSFDSGRMVLPLAISGVGILASLVGTFLVRTGPQASMSRLLWALRTGIFGAGALALVATAVVVGTLGLPFKLFWVVVTGLVVGQIIGTATEYFTSYEYRPTRWIAEQSGTGAASVIIAGIATGLLSTVVPTLAVIAGIWIANELDGLYGVALAAVGMLSTLGITLATDAYGPVADNAGGLAEQAHLDPSVRERTDALDALGNTTAATGKGFAIGSAVLTALALMAAYTEVSGVGVLNITDTQVLIGLILGGMLPFLFSALTMRAVGTAANAMIVEVRRQFREIPGLREGKEGVKPDAARAVDISTRGALRAMMLPGLIAVVAPILVGALISAEALGGLLVGSIVSGFLLAIFMANAGGAWDNAKKYVELGNLGGKKSAAHAATVVGDTVGDPFKDTSGPSINILLKLMAIVSVIFGPLFI